MFDNCADDVEVANMFANNFNSVYYDSSADDIAVKTFTSLKNFVSEASPIMQCSTEVSVELVDKCLHSLHRGKACGPDDLSAEHLLYAHPSLIIHLKMLFVVCLLHGYVPHALGHGVIIPLVKDKSAPLNSPSNYRGISLIPVIVKVFENVILSLCDDALVTSELQFGFKKNTSCSDAFLHYVVR